MGNAVERINKEMQEAPDDKFREVIGHYIIDRCEDPGCEAKVTEQKTLEGALEAVTALAKKSQHGNCAVLDDQTVFGEVDKYFGFPEYRTHERSSAPAGNISLNLNLVDFL